MSEKTNGKTQFKLNDFALEVHALAVRKGWWDEERSFGDIIALCHSELSEALEEHRDGSPLEYVRDPEGWGVIPRNEMPEIGHARPLGVAVEMADCIIRILDWCGKEGIDIERVLTEKHEYNRHRPYRHGGKKI